jgi:hypothetical protein
MSLTYDWFVCTPCGTAGPGFDERGLLERMLGETPWHTCPDCGEVMYSHSTVTYGDEPSTWIHGEG